MKKRIFHWSAGFVLIGGLLSVVFAHPAIEGGIKSGLFALKDVAVGHFELVADQAGNEVRFYVSQAVDEKLADGKEHEWVIPMAVQRKKIQTPGGEKDVDLMPLPDPAGKGEYFPVSAVETQAGFAFYWVELTAQVLLDGKASSKLSFQAGRDSKGTHCLKAPLDLSKASTIRFQEVLFRVLDPSGTRPDHLQRIAQRTYGLKTLGKDVPNLDLPLKLFAEGISKIPDLNKFRKPDAPILK